eukprot:42736_1
MKWRFVLGIFLVFVIKSGSLANLMEAESGHLGSPEPKQQDGGDSGEFNMFDMLANIDDGDSESVDDNESDPADYEDDDFFDDDESDSADDNDGRPVPTSPNTNIVHWHVDPPVDTKPDTVVHVDPTVVGTHKKNTDHGEPGKDGAPEPATHGVLDPATHDTGINQVDSIGGDSPDKIANTHEMMMDQGTDCTNADGCGARQDCIAKGGQKKCVCRSNGNLAPLMAECPQPVCG